jgi:hypothetical protein
MLTEKRQIFNTQKDTNGPCIQYLSTRQHALIFLHTFGSYVQQGDYMIIGTILAIIDTVSSYLLTFEEQKQKRLPLTLINRVS